MASPTIQRALVSVSDKQGLGDFVRRLVERGVEIYSTGGTRRFLLGEGIEAREISAYTGFPEMMDGRLKTLHPKIFGGILARRDVDEDQTALREFGILPFDLIVVNLYPFQATVARAGVTRDEAIEQIDIGGPSLVRAAAKNHAFVTIVTSPEQYSATLDEISRTGTTSLECRKRLAGEAFQLTAAYDRAIADYFASPSGDGDPQHAGSRAGGDVFPTDLHLAYQRTAELRYGENPHQPAALYREVGARTPSLVSAQQLHGKELSYNNLLDLDSALAIVRSLPAAAAAVIKHNNPCGAAMAAVLSQSAQRALDGDPVSAFGSVLGFNRTVDVETAEVLAAPGLFIEAIVAPDFAPDAFELLTTRPKWKANVRLLQIGPVTPVSVGADASAGARRATLPETAGARRATLRATLSQMGPGSVGWHFRQIDGGLLVQSIDADDDPRQDWRVATRHQPDERLWAELEFAWALVRHVKSNAIVLTADGSLCGVGAGQMSRVDSVDIAIRKAGPRASGSVLASDAFFPFADSIQKAAAAGVAAIIQPGGSKNDDDVIAACNEAGLPMIITGRRHFRH